MRKDARPGKRLGRRRKGKRGDAGADSRCGRWLRRGRQGPLSARLRPSAAQAFIFHIGDRGSQRFRAHRAGRSDGAIVRCAGRAGRTFLDTLPRRLPRPQRPHRAAGSPRRTGGVLRFRRKRSRISGLRCRGISLVLRDIRAKGSRVLARLHRRLSSNRELPHADFEAAQLFVPIRHIWLLGEWASRIHEWGSQAVPADWIATQLDIMLAWKGETGAGVALSRNRRVDRGALAPCPSFRSRCAGGMVGTRPDAFASGAFAHPTRYC